MPGEPIRILIVEDNPGDVRLIRKLLDRTQLGPFEISTVDRVCKAQSLLRGHPAVDVVLLDVSLPDSEGHSLDSLSRIRAAAPELPIVLLTGIEDEDLALGAVREGAQDYLVKRQVDRHVLARSLRYAIERKQAETALRESEERYALAVRGANDGLWDWDLKRDQIYFSPRWKGMLGHAEDEVGEEPREWFDRVHPDDLPRLRSEIDAHLAGETPHFKSEHRIRHREGSWRWVLSRGLAVGNGSGKPHRMAGSQSDITAHKIAEQRLLHDAFHDALTGLPNRALFIDRLGVAMAQARRRRDQCFAVLFLDLDRFKNVNDSLGHGVGDELLIAAARRLESFLRPGDTVARLGGDEFAILLMGAEGPHATRVANRVSRELAMPFNVRGHEVFVTVSLGIALSATGYYDQPEAMLRDADTAMYRAKTSGKARHALFDREMHERAVALLQLETDLRRAIEGQEFEIHYQPIISLASGEIEAFEALLRWRHPRRGLLHPDSFIPVAEDTGLIVPIDLWVLREACRQLAEWQEGQPADERPLAVSVNLSGRQFMQADLVKKVGRILRETGIRPGSLRLEITESTIMSQAEAAVSKLVQLRALGVQLYIDDFGTGYSSLSYLHRLPMDALKIDRSFISDMARGNERTEIVRTIVALAQTLRMQVAAEGLETADQLSQLRELSCHLGQGYFFSHPVDGAAAGGLIAAHARW